MYSQKIEGKQKISQAKGQTRHIKTEVPGGSNSRPQHSFPFSDVSCMPLYSIR